jgi:ubiquinone biosynthesis UbiH/UbiF/VisC/COQ6 family hydroxylase
LTQGNPERARPADNAGHPSFSRTAMPSDALPPLPHGLSSQTDVLIVGAGPAGLALAASLAQAGLQATVLEQQGSEVLAAPAPDGREIALTHPSVATLQRIGSWQRLAGHEIGLLREAQVHDGPVGQRGAMALHAGGTGVEHLGWIVPNHALRRTAYEVASRTPGVRIVTGARVTQVAVTPTHAELEYADAAAPDVPQRLRAPLLVAADSRFSATRRQLGIGASMNDFGRTVIVCRMRTEAPHGEVAHECFGYERTLAVLPLPPDPADGAPLCSAVVTAGTAEAQALMALPPEAFAARVQEQFQHRLGAMQLVGERHAYPLVAVYAHRFAAARCALLGDAAVGMHPVTAHGFNLGLSGMESLTRTLTGAHARGADIGAAIVRLYTDARPLPRLLRQAVLAGASRLPPLKAAIVSQLTGRRPAWPTAAGHAQRP